MRVFAKKEGHHDFKINAVFHTWNCTFLLNCCIGSFASYYRSCQAIGRCTVKVLNSLKDIVLDFILLIIITFILLILTVGGMGILSCLNF